jgi:hypothetical protein
VGLVLIARGARCLGPHQIEDAGWGGRGGTVGGPVQDAHERPHGANPGTAFDAFLGMELETPAREPAEVSLHVVRQVALGPSVVVAASEKAHRNQLDPVTRTTVSP